MTAADRSRRYRQRQAAKLEALQRLAQGDTMVDLGPPDTYVPRDKFNRDVVKNTVATLTAASALGACVALLLVATAQRDLPLAVVSGALMIVVAGICVATVNTLWQSIFRR